MLLDKTLDENEELLRKFQELNQGSFAPKTNEASVVPSEVDQMKVNPLVDEEKLAQLQDAQSRQLRNVGLFQAADQISRSIAAGYGGKVEPTDTSLMEESAKTPLKNYLETLKKYKESQSEIKSQQSDYMTTSGDPVDYIPNFGYRNVLTGEKITKPGSVIRNYTRTITDPITKEVKEIRPGQGIVGTIAGAPSKEPKSKTNEKDYAYEMLNPKQREQLEEQKTKFREEIKNLREFGETLQNADSLIDSDIPAAIGAIQRQLARTVGMEVGTMTDKDTAAFTGDPSFLASLQRFYEKQINGQITENDKKQFKQMINVVKQNISKSMENRARFNASEFKQYIPDATESSIFKMLSVDAAKPVGVQSQPAPEGKIKVLLPSGQTGFIDKDKVDAFKQKYPDAKVMQ